LGHYQCKLFEHERQASKHSETAELFHTRRQYKESILLKQTMYLTRLCRLLSYTHATYLLHVVKNYIRCLIAGNRYIFETLPKMLTLWLDFAAQMAEKHVENIDRYKRLPFTLLIIFKKLAF
jgi:hypothetical protein